MKKIIFFVINLIVFLCITATTVVIFILLIKSDRSNSQNELEEICKSTTREIRGQLLGGVTVLTALSFLGNDPSNETFVDSVIHLRNNGKWRISSVSLSKYFPTDRSVLNWADQNNINYRPLDYPIDLDFNQVTPDHLVISNTHPTFSNVGIDLFSDSQRQRTVLRGILKKNITVSRAVTTSDRQKILWVFYPLFNERQQFAGGYSGSYRKNEVILDEISSLNLAYEMRVDDMLLFTGGDYEASALKAHDGFDFYERSITFNCGRSYTTPLTPWLLLVLGIIAGFLIPFTILFSSKQIRKVRKETSARIKAEKDAADALLQKVTADENSKFKTMFLANMSHEIRTPLNGIKGNVEFLLDTPLNNEQKSFVDTLSESTGILMSIVNDILDFSKVESGKMLREDVSCSVHSIFSNLSKNHLKEATAKGIKLDIRNPDDELYIVTDPSRLRQILNNLLSNALKFTNSGNVDLTYEIIGDKIWFIVKDTGIGMTDTQVQNLFLPFQQADSSTSRKYGGTGLGLSISQKLVHLLDGQLFVTSDFGHGSTFSFYIPFKKGSRQDVPEKISRLQADNIGQTYHILIVDDNQINLKVAQRMLTKLSYKTTCVSDGQQALNEISSHPTKYDAILMDISMPVMDGYTSTTKIREQGSTIPIIAMTANVMEGEKERCLSYGMNDYVTKPLHQDELSNAILNNIKSRLNKNPNKSK